MCVCVCEGPRRSAYLVWNSTFRVGVCVYACLNKLCLGVKEFCEGDVF